MGFLVFSGDSVRRDGLKMAYKNSRSSGTQECLTIPDMVIG